MVFLTSSEQRKPALGPSQCGPIVVFLASDAAPNVTGQCIGASGYRISLYTHMVPEEGYLQRGAVGS